MPRWRNLTGHFAKRGLMVGEISMKYIAHCDEGREQSILDHLQGTAEKARGFAEVFGKGDWGYCCGMLHDIGKYSDKFQRRIHGEEIKVDHATAGARVCLELGGMYPFLEMCIAGHHAGLSDYGTSMDAGNSPTTLGRRKKKIEDFYAYKKEVKIPELKTSPVNVEKTKDLNFSLSMFTRMMYSCLVDADFLDTEEFMTEERSGRQQGQEIQVLLDKLEKYITEWLKNTETESVNGRRTEILKACLENGEREKGLFRLTVPTGGGKTVASLAFALRHAVKHHMKRIIYVIPYTSIIEQNAAVFRRILGDENVLENHCNIDYEEAEELKPMQLASENWDKPVVVTTNVQFFESLFSNKSSKCRKLHNMANSVIIFDEAQMLPNDYLKPCLTAIEELVINYKVSAVLCTATQPALDAFFCNIKQITELCPRTEEQFEFFKRVHFENDGKLSEEDVEECLLRETQALCIVNTKKKAQKIYNAMREDGVYHLSTSMYPKHRKRMLKQIKERLREGKKCIVISTSLVEAGVDLDFYTVYRQLSGIDSIIQAAGRCNREGKRTIEESKVVIFQFDDAEKVPGQRQQMDVSKALLANECKIEDMQTVTRYFEMLYHMRGESLDKKKICEEFNGGWHHFATVEREFKLIDENTVTVFVNQEEDAQEVIQDLKNKGFTKSGMRRAVQYCVNLYKQEFEKYNDAGMLKLVSEDIKDFYELTDLEQYSEETGLNLEVDCGMAVWL